MMQNTIRFAKQPLRRLPLYIMTGVEVPVLAAKQLHARGDFQGSDMPESATSRPLLCVFNPFRSIEAPYQEFHLPG
jgi:hypothetical protein